MTSPQPVAAVQHQRAPPTPDYADFVAHAPVGMHQVDSAGRILWANDAELAMLGYSRDDYVGADIRGFHEDRAEVDGLFQDLTAGRPVSNHRARLRRKDGTWLDVLISSNAVPDAAKPGTWRSRCVMRDISDLAALERRSEATSARLQQRERQQAVVARLSDMALAGTSMKDLASVAAAETTALYEGSSVGVGQLLDASHYLMLAGTGWMAPLAGQTLPYETTERSQARHHLGTTRAHVFSDLGAETRFRPSEMLVRHGVRSGVGIAIPGAHAPWGTLGLFSGQPDRFVDEDARFIESVAQVLAGAAARQAAEASLAARLRQQAAVAALGHSALRQSLQELMDAAAKEVAATLHAEFCKVLELDAHGKTLLLRAGVGWREGSIGHATVAADSHSQAGYALRTDRAVIVDDINSETRFESAPLLVEHGIVSGMSVIIRGHAQPYGVIGVHSRQRRAFTPDDINFLEAVANLLGTAVERLHVQTELRRSRDRLEDTVADRTRQLAASNRELEAFSYSVSHDLRAPLRTITGYSTLLTGQYGQSLTPQARELLQGVQASAERLGRLIDDLLDLSRVQRVDLVRDHVDLTAMAEQALAGLAAAEPTRKVAWTVEPGLSCEGDARLLGMLVDNLVGNAWKFTRRREGARITVGQTAGPEGQVFFVRDNGAGFDMAYAAKLFTPFQRLHRTSEFEGTGIGLATVSRIVERHGGRVWAEGRPREGATFSFTLGQGTGQD